MSLTATHLLDVVDAWLEVATTMTVRDLGRDTRRATLGGGAAGIAYVLARIGAARGDAELVAAGRRWLSAARRAATRPGGFPDGKVAFATGPSFVYGPCGVAAVAALVEPTTRTVAAYLDTVKRSTVGAPTEYNFGLAGNVHAALTIARANGATPALELARALAARLAKRAALPPGGFAHGDLGVTAARLAAARIDAAPVDHGLVKALARVEIDRVLGGPTLSRSWCNGLAGHVIAWVLAAELAGDDRCRTRALAAAPRLLEQLDDGGGSLCCGLGGRAYAMLAVGRLDPSGPWIDHAYAFALRALAHELPAGGLFQGLPGVIGLAHDLQRPESARFPFVDIA